MFTKMLERIRTRRSSATSVPLEPKLLVIDTSFSYQAIRLRGLEHSITCRDLDGFFAKVWSVHPFGSLVSDATVSKTGAPDLWELSPEHTFIDGKEGLSKLFGWLPKLNFIFSQTALVLSLSRLVRRERISVIRAADPLYNGLFGLILSRLTSVPLLVRVGANHDKIFETTRTQMMPRMFPSRRIEKAVARFVLARADCVAGANQNNLDFALANGARSTQATIFRYGNLIDQLHFEHPDTRELDEEWLATHRLAAGEFLLFVGRLEPVKHPEDAVIVLSELRKRGHSSKLLMAGDGQLLDRLRSLARSLDLEEQVIFCGNQSQARLACLYPAAAVFLSPHTGRALAEAALAGSRIVAYDVDWQGEIVVSGVSGELVPHRDVEAMANAAHEILTSVPYAKKLSRGARDHALGMMDPTTLDAHERDTYLVLIQHRHGDSLGFTAS